VALVVHRDQCNEQGGDLRLVKRLPCKPRPLRQAAKFVIGRRHDAHRNVARRRIVFEPIENDPPGHFVKVHVEHDDIRLTTLGQLEPVTRGPRDDASEFSLSTRTITN
jgi:hypothetical protein